MLRINSQCLNKRVRREPRDRRQRVLSAIDALEERIRHVPGNRVDVWVVPDVSRRWPQSVSRSPVPCRKPLGPTKAIGSERSNEKLLRNLSAVDDVHSTPTIHTST